MKNWGNIFDYTLYTKRKTINFFKIYIGKEVKLLMKIVNVEHKINKKKSNKK